MLSNAILKVCMLDVFNTFSSSFVERAQSLTRDGTIFIGDITTYSANLLERNGMTEENATCLISFLSAVIGMLILLIPHSVKNHFFIDSQTLAIEF